MSLDVVLAHVLIKHCDDRLRIVENENKALRLQLQTIRLTRNLHRNLVACNLATLGAFPEDVRQQFLAIK